MGVSHVISLKQRRKLYKGDLAKANYHLEQRKTKAVLRSRGGPHQKSSISQNSDEH